MRRRDVGAVRYRTRKEHFNITTHGGKAPEQVCHGLCPPSSFGSRGGPAVVGGGPRFTLSIV